MSGGFPRSAKHLGRSPSPEWVCQRKDGPERETCNRGESPVPIRPRSLPCSVDPSVFCPHRFVVHYQLRWLSFPIALRRGRKRISLSLSLFFLLLLSVPSISFFTGENPEPVGSRSESIPIVECCRLFRLFGNVAAVVVFHWRRTQSSGMASAFRRFSRDRLIEIERPVIWTMELAPPRSSPHFTIVDASRWLYRSGTRLSWVSNWILSTRCLDSLVPSACSHHDIQRITKLASRWQGDRP